MQKRWVLRWLNHIQWSRARNLHKKRWLMAAIAAQMGLLPGAYAGPAGGYFAKLYSKGFMRDFFGQK